MNIDDISARYNCKITATFSLLIRFIDKHLKPGNSLDLKGKLSFLGVLADKHMGVWVLIDIRGFSIKFILYGLVLIQLLACTPQQGGDGEREASKDAVNANLPTPTVPLTNLANNLFWFSDGVVVQTALQINADTQTVFYLRGDSINSYLSLSTNNQNTYCLVANYNISTTGAKKQLRARAVPIAFQNFSTGTVERLFRIDVNEKTINQNTCTGNAEQTIGGALPVNIGDADSAFIPADLCTNCTGVDGSLDVNLYTVVGGVITGNEVATTSLDLAALSLRVDSQSNVFTPSGTCTNASCAAQGFDCCLDGQCVNDGQIKSGVDQTAADFLQAAADVTSNPANFINYPQFYYICISNPASTPTPTATPDAVATATSLLKGRIFDKFCLDKFESSGGTDQTHCVNFSSCNQDALSVTDISNNNFNIASFAACTTTHTLVQQRVREQCGCAATLATPAPNDPDTLCPGYGYKSITDNNNIILDIICDVPPVVADPTPVQDLNLNINARRAPIRFHTATGTPVDEIETLFGTPDSPTSPVSEGAYFHYLDENSKTSPENEFFNMNAITGQISVNLTHALPAKYLPVEFDQVYIISAISGNYTPCPLCSADSWFQAFFPHPPSSGGLGLTAIGHTQTRDNWLTNITNGNYEDTIFGRACWLPPTMIPFSHQKNASLTTQRTNRLTTQAAFYSNGYQRDWFGFNKGALIGSFNGVTWFAIGKGRRVRATSNKLYLAINAPFADLADPTDIQASITTDQGNNVAADFDYDLNLSTTDVRQNLGASCQIFHECSKDSDCVAKLGWEYMCASVGNLKTLWPRFDIDAQELADQDQSISFIQMLQGSILPSGSLKRCVYRGSGAPCKQNYSNLSVTHRKNFTCAPNFYCAALTDSFNDRVVRTVNLIGNFVYGQEADVLGRPLNYLTGGVALPSAVQSNINANAANQDALFGTDSDAGICRPGKELDTANFVPNAVQQHSGKDSGNRTDYISQVGSCDSGVTGTTSEVQIKRVQTCPTFNTSGDYIYVDAPNGDISSPSDQEQFWVQNSCGGETTDTSNVSPFATLELEPLTSLTSISTPSVVKDACFRRAGAVCHTNLDCAPNKLHESVVPFFSTDYFGGTKAEQDYWQEGLVCGQANPVPFLNSTAFATYDITQNRCCREIGKDFTMYSKNDPDNATENPNLDPAKFGIQDPDATGRYSRYTVVGSFTADIGQTGPFNTVPDAQLGVTPERFQWKTFNDTGKKTCCGGSWIRKFTDGTHNWTNPNRLALSSSSLSCVNYVNTITDTKPDAVPQATYDNDFGRLCEHPRVGGCAHAIFPNTVGFQIDYPVDDNTFDNALSLQAKGALQPGFQPANIYVGVLNTFLFVPTNQNDPSFQLKSKFAPFQPIVVDAKPPVSSPSNFFEDCFEFVSFELPSYVNGEKNINNLFTTDVTNHNNKDLGDVYVHCSLSAACANTAGGAGYNVTDDCVPALWPAAADANQYWCVDTNNVLHVKRDGTGGCGTRPKKGIYLEFLPANTPNYIFETGGLDTTRQAFARPGNDVYYLTKLSRFELMGIPQILYEPIYCTTDGSKLVDGLFKDTLGNVITSRTNYDTLASFAYSPKVAGSQLGQIYDSTATGTDVANVNQRVSHQDQVAMNKIFSGHQFSCCTPLGETVASSDLCCSGFSAVDGNNVRTCKLPALTNLSVYFNRFVSGEGEGPTQPGGGLVDDDFVPETGEPKLRTSTNNKLIALGEAYCVNGKVRTGSLFGTFNGEPNNGVILSTPDLDQAAFPDTRYSILDSIADIDSTNQNAPKSLGFFNLGFKWNHQFYCDITGN